MTGGAGRGEGDFMLPSALCTVSSFWIIFLHLKKIVSENQVSGIYVTSAFGTNVGLSNRRWSAIPGKGGVYGAILDGRPLPLLSARVGGSRVPIGGESKKVKI